MRHSVVIATLLAALLGGLACVDSTSPERAALLGEWSTEPLQLGSGGTYRTTYRFDGRGTYRFESSSHGVYGRPSEELTSFFRLDGLYAVRCGRLFLQPDVESTWDRFYGADSPIQTRRVPYTEVGAGDPCSGGMEFTRLGDRLILHYMGQGPADEPIEVTTVLIRVR